MAMIGDSLMEHPQREHLFISYAWEDAPIAQWVSRKLISCGYKVWRDNLALYGGCLWSDKIEDAIKNKAFRMIHILSRKSITKINPKNELQVGYLMSQTIPDFLIPLNTEGIPPIELPWQMPNIQFIDFQDWRKGFSGLLKALEIGKCPRFDVEQGVREAIESYMPVNAVKNEPETLYSNAFEVIQMPKVIKRYMTNSPLLREEFEDYTKNIWPAYFLNSHECLAFSPPPLEISSVCRYEEAESFERTSNVEIAGVRTYSVEKRLIEKCVRTIAAQKGFKEQRGCMLFPQVQGGKKFFKFVTHDGHPARLSPLGHKKVRGHRINYSLAFYPSAVQLDNKWHVVVSLRIVLYNNDGTLLDVSQVPSCRKAIAGSWWNGEWFARHTAIAAALSNEASKWCLVQDDKSILCVSGVPVSGISETSLDDAKISEIAKQRKSSDEDQEDLVIGEDVKDE